MCTPHDRALHTIKELSSMNAESLSRHPHLARLTSPALFAGLTLACLLATGCRVNEQKDGNKEKVDIQTPFGNMNVNTDKSADTAAIGLSAYPGATPVNDDNSDSDKGNNADVNMSFGNFHLGVKAATFQTPDSPDKVLAFYRKDMGRYGDVIECQGHKTVGSPSHTAQGLSCSDNADISTTDSKGHSGFSYTYSDDRSPKKTTGSDDDLELRAGSRLHQHIVSVTPKDGGTRIGLVMLDLPSGLDKHDKTPE
jgi:hypothetical protein